LGISGALMIALLMALGGLEIALDYQRTMDAAFERLENLARIADESVSGRIRAIDVMLQDITHEAQEASSQPEHAALLVYMKARAASLEGVRSISVFSADGKVTLTTLPNLQGFDGSQRPYFTAPKASPDQNRLFIHGPLLTRIGSIVLLASRAKLSMDGVWDGVVVASLPPAFFASILDTIAPQNSGFATLLGHDGTIAARSPDQDKLLGRSVAKGMAFELFRASKQRMIRTLVPTVMEGKRSLIVIRATAYPELLVSLGLPQEEVVAEWRDKALLKVGVLGLLALVASVMLRRFSRHEDELVAQRNFARQLVQTANVLVVGLDRNGVVRMFNGTAEAATGFEQHEILGRNWFDTIAVGDGMAEIVKKFADDGALPGQFDGPIRAKTGTKRVISWQNSTVTGQDIVSMSFGIDITERLQAEERVIASQRFVQAITDNLPGMVGYWDVDLRCRFANKPYLDWFGRSPEQIIGQTMLDLLGDRLYAMNEPHIRQALQGKAQHFERTLTKANGETGFTWAHYIPDIDANGAVTGFFVLVSDITPLKNAESALRVASHRLALATKAGGIGVWDLELDSRTVRWDERMFQIYGRDESSTVLDYGTWCSWCVADDVPRIEGELAVAIRDRTDFDSEFRIITPDDGLRHIKTSGTVEYDGEGRARRVIGVNWDITSIREKEEALQAAQAAAEKASQAKSEFLANMSHEIRTPMNAILGLSHLLERTELTVEQQDFVGKITQSGRGLLTIINDILDFSRVEAGRLELDLAPFDLSVVLDTVSTIMSINASDKELELLIDLAPDTPVDLIGDSLRLQQVLINLTSNAIKFTETGMVVLRVERLEGEGNEALLRFSVQDSGIGIAAEAIPMLFAAFSQADSSTTRRFGGSGLGLAICKQLVGLMGGEIGVDSQPGHGSCFWFTTPLALSPETKAESGDRSSLEVLIADDHETARQIIARTAESLGWNTDIAETGHEAVERAQDRLRRGKPFDALILDWKTPELDGLAVSRQIQEFSEEGAQPIVVIMVTGYSRDILLHTSGVELVDAVLVKPVTMSALRSAVMEALSRRGALGLPRKAEDPVVAVEKDRLAGVRLLVVEDNRINQAVAQRVLELEGAVVMIVSDGQQAVDRLRADPEAFDVVLMDVHMPVMDGYEATERIRQDLELTALPIIALTAGALAEEREHAEQVGMNDFITKPFDVDEAVRCIRRHLVVVSAGSAPGVAERDEGLAAIPGIDMMQAAQRLGADGALLAQLLPRFVEEFSQAAPKIREQLRDGDSEGATSALHALKGAAGNLAAVDIAVLAQAAERAIHAGRHAELPSLLKRLDSAFAVLNQYVAQSSVLPS
jgi:two-component system, sensor histidine kinase and response regulator